MPIMVQKPKWILYKHTNNFEMVRRIAVLVKGMANNLGPDQRHLLQQKMAALDFYNPRNRTSMPLDSMNHRINTLEYFLFGYEEKCSKRFIFGPLGNLFIKHLYDKEKERKIFASMLWGVQFPTPANGTPSCFKVFPFRLIFKLMLDERLSHRLYDTDYARYVAFEKECTPDSYEQLVQKILDWRKLAPEQQFNELQKDQHTYVNCIYEWAYYTKELLAQAGVLVNKGGEAIGRLYHPTKENSKSQPTGRTVRNGYAYIPNDLVAFIEQLEDVHSAFDTPLLLKDDPDRLEFDVVKEIYSFYPFVLLDAIGERDPVIEKLLSLPKLIEEYSRNEESGDAYLFEDVLAEGLNMFSNVEAVKVGGAGNSDIVCKYQISPTEIVKFDIEAKSTSKKLLGINAGRLRSHREDIAGMYTIVITPIYVPAVIKDIVGEPIVIILASTFSEYLYNNIYYGNRDLDFKEFDEIISNHLGQDVSRLISDMTITKFASAMSMPPSPKSDGIFDLDFDL